MLLARLGHPLDPTWAEYSAREKLKPGFEIATLECRLSWPETPGTKLDDRSSRARMAEGELEQLQRSRRNADEEREDKGFHEDERSNQLGCADRQVQTQKTTGGVATCGGS